MLQQGLQQGLQATAGATGYGRNFGIGSEGYSRVAYSQRRAGEGCGWPGARVPPAAATRHSIRSGVRHVAWPGVRGLDHAPVREAQVLLSHIGGGTGSCATPLLLIYDEHSLLSKKSLTVISSDPRPPGKQKASITTSLRRQRA